MIHIIFLYCHISLGEYCKTKTNEKTFYYITQNHFSHNHISSLFPSLSLCRLGVTAPNFPTESSPNLLLLSSALAFCLSLLLIWEADQWEIMRANGLSEWMVKFGNTQHRTVCLVPFLGILKNTVPLLLLLLLDWCQGRVTFHCNHTKISSKLKGYQVSIN